MREVLSTAGKLEESTLLIYANDAVLDTTGLTTDLPDALKVCMQYVCEAKKLSPDQARRISSIPTMLHFRLS
jgi:hypothetical protein